MIYRTKNLSRVSLLFAAIVLCSCAVFSTRSADPVYHGKTLSEWLLFEYLGQDLEGEAEPALRQIGTNAIPLLLDLVGTTEWNKGRLAAKFKTAAGKRLPLRGIKAEDFRSMGLYAFQELGTNAESAVPRLAKLLRNEETCMEAAAVLAGVGPKGFAVLTNAFQDRDLVEVVVLALGSYGGGDQKAITRLLITALKDPDPIIRGNAADRLAGKDAALAVPALIPVLDDSEYYPRARAAMALTSFGAAAQSAAPKLLMLYTNVMLGPDRLLARNLGSALLDALRSIDRQAAGQAEAFLLNNGPLGVAGYGWTTTRLPGGRELIAGGTFQTTFPTKTNHTFSRAELFDPATGTRTKTASMNVARYGHTATLLRNGKVLVAGGEYDGADGRVHHLTSAEVYDPAIGTWTMTGSMNSPHPNQKAVLQSDGKVRVSDEVYDPASGKWSKGSHK